MRKAMILAVAVGLLATSAWAASSSSARSQMQISPQGDMQNPFPQYNGLPKDRNEAIQRQKARLAVMEKMSDADWSKWQDQQKKNAEKWRVYQQMQRSRLLQQQSNQQQPRNIAPSEQDKVRQDFLNGTER